ncbi:hypothetical protein AALP_AA2G170700 [Arabis alpina]|uniref:Uncharacterized protein n=1 Tax=Arabis alpina TaxID=50452 RepID=A0A087HI24_ARAAL|nr:hypothetical protein AALP_AA2G170700 [Arabis alpina]
MSGREVREYTNLSDPKDKKSGKGKIDDEDVTIQRMVAKMQEVAGERGGYLHGRGGINLFACSFHDHTYLLSFLYLLVALDSDDLLYLKEQMEAEEDAERLLKRTEKRAFAAFKKAATQADSSPASVPLALRVEPKPKSGIRHQDLLKKVVEVNPKRPKISTPSNLSLSPPNRSDRGQQMLKISEIHRKKKLVQCCRSWIDQRSNMEQTEMIETERKAMGKVKML